MSHPTAPLELERRLRSPDAARVIPAAVRRHLESELARLRRHLLHTVCSQAWFSDCWATGGVFPPRADTTPMFPCACQRCRATGRLWPAVYGIAVAISEEFPQPQRVSFECYLESLSDLELSRFPSSPSGLALRAIREGRIKLRRRRTRVARRGRPKKS
jgi:hypothetical protein